MNRIVIAILGALFVLCAGIGVANAQAVRLTNDDILAAGEIWVAQREAQAPHVQRDERGPDGKVILARVIYVPAVWDLAWMIKARFAPLARAMGTASATVDPRVAVLEAKIAAARKALD